MAGARPLKLNFGYSVFSAAAERAGLLTWCSRPVSVHGTGSTQRGFFREKIKNRRALGGTFDFLFLHGASEVLSGDGVEGKFDSARHAELVIDRAQVVSDCVLGERELVADVPRAQTIRKQVDDLRFARG